MLSPVDIAKKSIDIGKTKANLKTSKMLLLGVLAGMFIAIAGVGATFGSVYVGKIVGAMIFPVGLIMVVIAGSELFTGNNLMISAWLRGEISGIKLLRNWFIVFFGNLLGALFITILVVYSGVFDNIADQVIATATTKSNLIFHEAFIRGILCNFLVCIAVWMAFSTNSVSGKVLAIYGPIMIFVLCGFEHCVANMFYGPAGILIAAKNNIALDALSLDLFLRNNLIPVTLGNMFGVSILVVLTYYLIYSCNKK